MYTNSIITLKIARKINRNVDFPGFSKSFIRLSANPHRKLRIIISGESAMPCWNLPTPCPYTSMHPENASGSLRDYVSVAKASLHEHSFELRCFSPTKIIPD